MCLFIVPKTSTLYGKPICFKCQRIYIEPCPLDGVCQSVLLLVNDNGTYDVHYVNFYREDFYYDSDHILELVTERKFYIPPVPQLNPILNHPSFNNFQNLTMISCSEGSQCIDFCERDKFRQICQTSACVTVDFEIKWNRSAEAWRVTGIKKIEDINIEEALSCFHK